jgi:hypothetical protein
MSVEDVVLVATVREHVRSKAIQVGVSPTEISRRVEAMQAGMLVPAADDEVLPESPTSRTGEEKPGSMYVTTSPGLEERCSNSSKAAVIEPVNGKTFMSAQNLVSPGRR